MSLEEFAEKRTTILHLRRRAVRQQNDAVTKSHHQPLQRCPIQFRSFNAAGLMKLFFKMEMACCKSAGCNESISGVAVGAGDGVVAFGETDGAGVGDTAAFAA